MKRVLTSLFVLYVSFLIIQYGIIFTALKKEPYLSPMATGEVRFCINHEPVINYTCETTTNTSIAYFCQVQATDQDNHTLSYDLTFINASEIFNISQEGEINFTPSISDDGNYTFLITVFDETGCSNYYDTVLTSLEIVRTTNTPPYLSQNIPNLTMNQDTTLTSFDLDDYFADAEGDLLTYTFTYSTNVTVTLTANNEVVFNPASGYFGTETFYFFAWDPYNANATSNKIGLRVTRTTTSSGGSGGSGGGGGGGGGGGIYCMPKWYCTPWGECMPDNLRRRECYDMYNCTTTYLKPNTTEACEYVSTCYDGIKGSDEEGVDCGGSCPPCGTCYDDICNNNEDCLNGIIKTPDCGGSCRPCDYTKESCFDNICNNGEDCTRNITDIPDCGGKCKTCPRPEQPAVIRFNWLFWSLIISMILILGYTIKKTYPYILKSIKKRKIMLYEQRLLLETKVVESILENLAKIEKLIETERIEKLIMLFSDAMRRYFRNLLDLNYEFTYEELIEEITNRNLSSVFKKVLEDFFNRSLEMEYSGKSVSKEELKAMISEFKVILSMTSQEPLKTQELIPGKKLGKLDSMFSKITGAEEALRKKNMNKAYELYLEIHNEFNTLNDDEKKKLHGFISRLYYEIRLAREEYI